MLVLKPCVLQCLFFLPLTFLLPVQTKTEFKKPTRLECMMQDLPKLFSPSHEVGICQFELWTAFNPVKNAIADAVAKQKAGVAAECAASGEAAMYEWGRKMLLEAGAAFTNSSSSTLSSSSTSSPSTVSYKGVTVSSGPLVVLDPSFGVTQREVLKKLAGKISISSTSSLGMRLVSSLPCFLPRFPLMSLITFGTDSARQSHAYHSYSSSFFLSFFLPDLPTFFPSSQSCLAPP